MRARFLIFYLRERKKRKNRKNILEVVIIGAVETVEKPAKAYSSRKYGHFISPEQAGKAVENFGVTLWISFCDQKSSARSDFRKFPTFFPHGKNSATSFR